MKKFFNPFDVTVDISDEDDSDTDNIVLDNQEDVDKYDPSQPNLYEDYVEKEVKIAEKKKQDKKVTDFEDQRQRLEKEKKAKILSSLMKSPDNAVGMGRGRGKLLPAWMLKKD